MLMGSAVLKQASPLVAYYYAALTPWVHYVPFYQYHTADILETVAALRANDAQAKAIAQNAYRFARLHLARPARLCYYRELFARMAPLYRYKPSCKDRPMCVPLLEELKYMGWFTMEQEEDTQCDIHAQLDDIHGRRVDRGPEPARPYGAEPKFFHGYDSYSGYVVRPQQDEPQHEPQQEVQQQETLQHETQQHETQQHDSQHETHQQEVEQQEAQLIQLPAELQAQMERYQHDADREMQLEAQLEAQLAGAEHQQYQQPQHETQQEPRQIQHETWHEMQHGAQ